MIPEVLDFRITSQCALRCPFCFGTAAPCSIDSAALGRFFSFMRDQGLRYVVLTGGEPTQSPAFPEVLHLLRALGIEIALSTNGLFWPDERLRALILSSCRWIALPMESALGEVHNRMRRCALDHHALVHSILGQIRAEAPQIKLKLGTVVSQENVESIPPLLDTLPVQPDVWRLFQLSRSEKNAAYYQRQRVDDQTFGRLVQETAERYQARGVKIQASYDRERDGRYLFLEPDGQLKTIRAGRDFVVGSCTHTGPGLVQRIGELVDPQRTNANFFNSFDVSE